MQETVGLAVALCCWPAAAGWTCCTGAAAAFLNGMLVGMYPLFFIGYTACGTLAFDRPDTPLLPLPHILTFMLNTDPCGRG